MAVVAPVAPEAGTVVAAAAVVVVDPPPHAAQAAAYSYHGSGDPGEPEKLAAA